MVTRKQGVVLALVLAASTAGCSSFLTVTARNLTVLPIQSCDEMKMAWRNRRRAHLAWVGVLHSFPEQCWTKDFAVGFKDGYADYLTNGGNGEPPATPPFRYRLQPYQTPDGLRAIEEYYAGFRHGSKMALASGQRETIIIPLSAPPINAVERFPNGDLPALAPLPTFPPGGEPEDLNPPRRVAPLK